MVHLLIDMYWIFGGLMRKISLDKGIAGLLIIIIAIVVLFWIGQRANLWINGIGIIANDVEDIQSMEC